MHAQMELEAQKGINGPNLEQSKLTQKRNLNSCPERKMDGIQLSILLIMKT